MGQESQFDSSLLIKREEIQTRSELTGVLSRYFWAGRERVGVESKLFIFLQKKGKKHLSQNLHSSSDSPFDQDEVRILTFSSSRLE